MKNAENHAAASLSQRSEKKKTGLRILVWNLDAVEDWIEKNTTHSLHKIEQAHTAKKWIGSQISWGHIMAAEVIGGN